MAKWRLTFEIDDGSGGETESEWGRNVLKRLTELDPLPIRAVYEPGGCVKAVFAVDVQGQIEAVRRQNDIDEKLRAALEGLKFEISFENPKLPPNKKKGS